MYKVFDVIVYLNTGTTLFFKGVDKVDVFTGGFTFHYQGKSTGTINKAVFYHASAAGYSILNVKEEEK